MELKITIEELREKGLSLTQYIVLWGLYNQVKVKYLVLDEEGIEDLKKRSWVGQHPSRDELALTTKGLELFEPLSGIFDEFIEVFPTRVTNTTGEVRVLSPASPSTMAGKKLKHKWHVITKNNTDLQRKIVECLKQEVIVRKNEGSLYWMRNAETWLNKCTWEGYEYLLESPKKEDEGFKINEIRL